jgi:hypothetical protein
LFLVKFIFIATEENNWHWKKLEPILPVSICHMISQVKSPLATKQTFLRGFPPQIVSLV